MEAADSAPRYTLYGTSGCHLCEIAEAMLLEQRAAGAACDFEVVDISESDALFERYGLLIPVLRRLDGEELNWPFTSQQLAQFLAC